MAQRQMSFLPLPSWVETTLLSERHSRTTMGLVAELLAGEILGRRKEGRKCVPAQQEHLQRSSRNGRSCTYLTLFQFQQSLSLLLLKVE